MLTTSYCNTYTATFYHPANAQVVSVSEILKSPCDPGVVTGTVVGMVVGTAAVRGEDPFNYT